MPNLSYEANGYPTFVINLKHRIERRESIKKEFSRYPEYNLKIVEAIQHDFRSVSLWQSIKEITTKRIKSKALSSSL